MTQEPVEWGIEAVAVSVVSRVGKRGLRGYEAGFGSVPAEAPCYLLSEPTLHALMYQLDNARWYCFRHR